MRTTLVLLLTVVLVTSVKSDEAWRFTMQAVGAATLTGPILQETNILFPMQQGGRVYSNSKFAELVVPKSAFDRSHPFNFIVVGFVAHDPAIPGGGTYCYAAFRPFIPEMFIDTSATFCTYFLSQESTPPASGGITPERVNFTNIYGNDFYFTFDQAVLGC